VGVASVGRGAVATLPLFRQLGQLLPVAATAPSRTALVLLTAVHIIRSGGNILLGLAERALVAAGGPGPDDLHRLLARGVAAGGGGSELLALRSGFFGRFGRAGACPRPCCHDATQSLPELPVSSTSRACDGCAVGGSCVAPATVVL
jgi:hypothetical protein